MPLIVSTARLVNRLTFSAWYVTCRFRADKKLEPSARIIIERSANLYSLRMPIVNLEHADCYMVKALNVAGVATAKATLRVAGKFFHRISLEGPSSQ